MFGLSGLISILIFYLAHTGDLATTILGLRNDPKVFEANPIFASAHGSPIKMGLIKYTFATLILVVVFLVPAISLAILGDTLFELGITTNNIYQQRAK